MKTESAVWVLYIISISHPYPYSLTLTSGCPLLCYSHNYRSIRPRSTCSVNQSPHHLYLFLMLAPPEQGWDRERSAQSWPAHWPEFPGGLSAGCCRSPPLRIKNDRLVQRWRPWPGAGPPFSGWWPDGSRARC